MKRFSIALVFFLWASFLDAQTTRTAASSNLTDVQTTVNASSAGDIVQIPCSPSVVTWSGTLNISVPLKITALGATPNNLPSQFGAGSLCLTIVANTTTLTHFTPTYNGTNNVTTIENIIIRPGAGAYSSAQNSVPILANCVGTSSGQPQLRVDNIQFGDSTAAWRYADVTNSNGEFAIIEDNCVGVADHNTLYGTAGGSPLSHVALISVNMTSYKGVGLYGDNSFAQPDTMGQSDAFYVENNKTYQQLWPIQETEQQFPNIGGGRAVVRFNQSTMDGTFGYDGGHGLDTTGRTRSVRHVETYGNQLSCINGPQGNTCSDLCIFRGGTGMCWGNTGTVTGVGTHWNEVLGLSTLRPEGDIWTNIAGPYGISSPIGMGGCGGQTTFSGGSTWPNGGNTADNAVGPFDLNDGTTYYSGTAIGGTSGTHIVISGTPWTTSQWAHPSDSFPYSITDLTQGWTSYVTANSSNTADVFQSPHGYINGGTFINAASGDSFIIRRTKGCIDGTGMGQMALLTGVPARLNSTGLPGPANPAFDPFYEWNNTFPALSQQANNANPQSIANLTFFTDNSLGNPHIQTSPTSPFDGNHGGIGFGTLANIPPSCTPNTLSGVSGVGYLAVDQGTWNTSSNGFGQGTFYECSATNTWTKYYGANNSTGQPYIYPHPLVSGAPPPCTISFSPPTGTYSSTQTVTISTSSCPVGTQVFYRTDGLPATNIDTQYSTPITVSSSQTLTAKAVLTPTIRDQPQTISTQKKCNAVGSPITFPSGYSCTNGSGGVAGTASDFNFAAGSSNQIYVSTTDSTDFDTSVLLIDTPTATDNNITEMSHRIVYQDSTNCSQSAPNKYKCIDVSETDSESCCDATTNALWQMSVRCSTNVTGSSGNNGFLEGDASSGSEKWDIPCIIGASTDLTVNNHWTLGDTGCGGSGCMVLDSIYLNGTQYTFPASCDSSDTHCPNYPMTPQPTYGHFIGGSQDQVYARNVSVAGTSPLTTTRNISFGRVGVDEGSKATGSSSYVINPPTPTGLSATLTAGLL